MNSASRGSLMCPTSSCIETASGQFVDVESPDPSTLTLADIAHHLSWTNRFVGAAAVGYSVAEHSLLVHDLLAYLDAPPQICAAGLLHDSSEAFLHDVATPIKRHLRTRGEREYDLLTQRMDQAIGKALGVDHTLWRDAAVEEADLWALRIEGRGLLPSRGEHWAGPALPNEGDLPLTIAWCPGRRSPSALATAWSELALEYLLGEIR